MTHRANPPGQWKGEHNIHQEASLKGFSFNSLCTQFIIKSPEKAYSWAYDLGLSWSPSKNASIYEWFHSFFEPSGHCLRFFRDYRNARNLSQQDNLFYVYLIMSYFRGLRKTGLVNSLYLATQWQDMREKAICEFSLKPSTIPEQF